jgi:hypothetical protein
MQKFVSSCCNDIFRGSCNLVGRDRRKDAIIKEEKAVWETVKSKSYDAFRKYLTSDYQGVYKEGIMNLEKRLRRLKKPI